MALKIYYSWLSRPVVKYVCAQLSCLTKSWFQSQAQKVENLFCFVLLKKETLKKKGNYDSKNVSNLYIKIQVRTVNEKPIFNLVLHKKINVGIK